MALTLPNVGPLLILQHDERVRNVGVLLIL